MVMKYYKTDSYLGSGEFVPTNATEISKEQYDSLLNDVILHSELIDEYFNKVKSGEMTIDEIENEEDRAEIQRRIDAEPQNDYGISDETYNNIIDDYTMQLIEEGAIA